MNKLIEEVGRCTDYLQLTDEVRRKRRRMEI